jgi:hypothetical protein
LVSFPTPPTLARCSPRLQGRPFSPAIFSDMEDWGNTVNLVGRLKSDVTQA